MSTTYAEENIFGKMRGRFDERVALSAVEDVVARVVWGFASLSDDDKARAIEAFNRLHDDPRSRTRYRIVQTAVPKWQAPPAKER